MGEVENFALAAANRHYGNDPRVAAAKALLDACKVSDEPPLEAAAEGASRALTAVLSAILWQCAVSPGQVPDRFPATLLALAFNLGRHLAAVPVADQQDGLRALQAMLASGLHSEVPLARVRAGGDG